MLASLLPTLKTAILVETDPAFIALRQANETGQMAAFYNQQASPSFTVWRSSTPTAEVFNAIAWKNFTPVDIPDGTTLYANRASHALLCQQNIMTLIQGSTQVATGKVNVRALLSDALTTLYTAAGGAAQAAGWAGAGGVKAAISRTVTRGEKLFCTGTGSSGTPGDLGGFEGDVSNDDILNALRLP